MFVPGEEALEDGELRVTVLGSGNPWVTRGQASGSILVEVGNPERDLLIFDLGSGSLANYASLKLPVNLLDKVFLTHLHADHTADLITLSGSYLEGGAGGRAGQGVGSQRNRTAPGHAALRRGHRGGAGLGHGSRRRRHQPGQHEDRVTEFDFMQTQVVYEDNGVKITSFPVIHALSGAVGYRVDFAGLTFVHSGDTRAGWPLVRACEGGVDLLIHECFPPAVALAAASGLSIERATMALNAAHTSPSAAGKVFGLVKPRMAGLWHTLLSPQVIPLVFAELSAVYDGPVVQTQDLTVFNITKEAVVARQAQVIDQLPPIRGKQRVAYTPVLPAPPGWWAEALIPLD